MLKAAPRLGPESLSRSSLLSFFTPTPGIFFFRVTNTTAGRGGGRGQISTGVFSLSLARPFLNEGRNRNAFAFLLIVYYEPFFSRHRPPLSWRSMQRGGHREREREKVHASLCSPCKHRRERREITQSGQKTSRSSTVRRARVEIFKPSRVAR